MSLLKPLLKLVPARRAAQLRPWNSSVCLQPEDALAFDPVSSVATFALEYVERNDGASAFLPVDQVRPSSALREREREREGERGRERERVRERERGRERERVRERERERESEREREKERESEREREGERESHLCVS
jgi:hypothetical protein